MCTQLCPQTDQLQPFQHLSLKREGKISYYPQIRVVSTSQPRINSHKLELKYYHSNCYDRYQPCVGQLGKPWASTVLQWKITTSLYWAEAAWRWYSSTDQHSKVASQNAGTCQMSLQHLQRLEVAKFRQSPERISNSKSWSYTYRKWVEIPGRKVGRTAGSLGFWWDVGVWNQVSLWELSDCFGEGIEELQERLSLP